MNYIITISSKNKNSLKNFFKFYNKKLAPIASHSLVLSQTQKKTSQKIISILKSPHVNKTAQVHYSSRKFTKQILVFSYKSYLFSLFFKKIQARLFPDIVIEIKSSLKFKHITKLNSKFLDPDHFVIDLKASNDRNATTPSNLFEVQPIQELKSLTKKKNPHKLAHYKSLCAKSLNYFKVWDCYGESVFLSFK
uniref:Ribosomal protein S10 n=1 Tax=Haslea nusantara TaxID=2600302 RepID=A0A5B8I0K5_9STRA|nr:ribosomal protein S10 [Haslea nusantara]QDX17594.1 ribosomal protein S10 [Haslea nusantara]